MRFSLVIPGVFLLASAAAGAQTPPPARPLRKPAPAVAPTPAPAPRTPAAPFAQFDLAIPVAPLPAWDHFPMMVEWEMQLPQFEHNLLTMQHDFEFQLDHSLAMAHEAWAPMPQMAPMALMANEFPFEWAGSTEPKGSLLRARPEQGTAEDSLYRAGREALNRGEYNRASTLFQSLEQKYPRSRVAPAALYYRAFALYRSGATDELRTALEALKTQQERYPEAATDPDAASLRTRLYAALAARGDAQAAAALRAASSGEQVCDREDAEVRAEALNALAQINPSDARPTLKKVLARRDDCSVRLRRSAVYILGRSGTEEAFADLLEVAKNDPDPTVKSDAINMLGRSSGTATVRTLETIFNESTDDRTRQAVLSALKTKGGPEATRVLKAIIERNDVPERMRSEAISQLSSSAVAWSETMKTISNVSTTGPSSRRVVSEENEDAAYLRNLYAKTESPALRSAIISAVARMGGSTNEQFLLTIVKNKNEESRVRREALSRLRTTTLSVDELGKLFEALSERDLRSAIVNQLGSREDAASVDKLIEIIKSGTDPQIRREAISALARRKDPRATKMLLELVEKP